MLTCKGLCEVGLRYNWYAMQRKIVMLLVMKVNITFITRSNNISNNITKFIRFWEQQKPRGWITLLKQ